MKRATIKCPWCGREVGWSKANRLEPHLQSPRVRCVGGGQPREQVEWLRAQRDAKGG